MPGDSTTTNLSAPQGAQVKGSPAAAEQLERARTLVRFVLRTACGGPLCFDTLDQIGRALDAALRDLDELKISLIVAQRRALS